MQSIITTSHMFALKGALTCGVTGDRAARLRKCATGIHRHISHEPVSIPTPCLYQAQPSSDLRGVSFTYRYTGAV